MNTLWVLPSCPACVNIKRLMANNRTLDKFKIVDVSKVHSPNIESVPTIKYKGIIYVGLDAVKLVTTKHIEKTDPLVEMAGYSKDLFGHDDFEDSFKI